MLTTKEKVEAKKGTHLDGGDHWGAVIGGKYHY